MLTVINIFLNIIIIISKIKYAFEKLSFELIVVEHDPRLIIAIYLDKIFEANFRGRQELCPLKNKKLTFQSLINNKFIHGKIVIWAPK